MASRASFSPSFHLSSSSLTGLRASEFAMVAAWLALAGEDTPARKTSQLDSAPARPFVSSANKTIGRRNCSSRRNQARSVFEKPDFIGAPSLGDEYSCPHEPIDDGFSAYTNEGSKGLKEHKSTEEERT